MFDMGFPKEWSTMRKLLWIRRVLLSGAAVIWRTVTGAAPLTLANALAKPIKSLVQYGKCVQNGTPTPDAPVDIVCNNGALKYDPYVGGIIADGTPEVLSVGGANLFNPATVPDEFAYINKATGKTLKHANFRHSDFIAITGDVDYYFGVVGYSASSAGLAWYSDANEGAYISGVSGTTLTDEGKVATAPATAKYVRFSWQIDEAHNADWEQSVYLCINGTLDAWEPYRAPQTASVENLFAVGDYKDKQDIISGAVTRRVGIAVLTGEERIYYSASSSGLARFRFAPDNMVSESGYGHVLCSHYEDYAANRDGAAFRYGANILFCDSRYTNADDFKAWLAAQYAAGTPVIVVYPLAAETTETVAAQALATENGENTISVTSNVVPVDLSVVYTAAE